MKYSILIPVYNVEKYLEKCLDSVLSQTYTDYEVILADDGSKDSSGEICDRYALKDKRIRVFHKENSGLLLTRRYSIKRAQGTYFLFLDSDDYWDSNLLETVDRAVCEFDPDMVMYRYRKVSEDGTPKKDMVNILPDRSVYTEENKNVLLRKVVETSELNNMWSKCVRRDIVDIDRDYTAFGDKRGEDILQSTPLFINSKKAVYINDVLYNYRLSQSGRSRNFKEKYVFDTEIARKEILRQFTGYGISQEIVDAFFVRYCNIQMNFLSVSMNQLGWKRTVKLLKSMRELELVRRASKITKVSEIYGLKNKMTHLNYKRIVPFLPAYLFVKLLWGIKGKNTITL